MFIGLADNIFVDTPSLGTPGLGWVLQSGGVQATLDIDFVVGRAIASGVISTIPSLLTCTRATPAAAYYQNADLTLSTFAANTLRFGSNGLLVEEARTNLCLRSQTLTNAFWTQNHSSASDNTTTALDGTLTAGIVIEDSTSNFHFAQSSAIATGANPIVVSYYAKPAGRTWVYAAINDGADKGAYVNLSTGAIGNAIGAGATVTTNILANGWVRINISLTTAGSTSVYLFPAQNNGVNSYLGDGVSGVFFWGVQVELGAFATSYIPTTSASVSRAADVVSYIGTIPVGAAGTYYAATNGLHQSTSNQYIVGTQQAANTNVVPLYVVSGGLTTVGSFDNAADDVEATAGSGNFSGAAKVALAYSGVTQSLVFNAGTVATGASDYAAPSAINLGSRTTGAALIGGGYITRFAAWNSRLSDGALQTLTT